jgi:chromosome partitioning protein
MNVVAVICRKGGVGKTTIATHLAVAAEKLGLVTVVFDLDPQASAASWGDHRGESNAPAVVAAQSSRLPLLLKQAESQDADLIILDTPPHADTTATAAVAKADLVLIPTRAAGLDLEALPASVQLARISGKPFFIVINAAPVQGSEVAEAQQAFAAEGIEVAPVVLHHRKAYSSHWQIGQTAEDFDPGGKAAGEIRELMLWLCDRLGMTKPPKPARKTA